MTRLSIEGLHWAVPEAGRSMRHLLQGVDLQVDDGEFVGLIGPNGSGKTSLLRCAYRATQPSEGRVYLNGVDVWQRSPRWCAQRIAVVLQEFPEEFGLSVGEVVAMGRTPHKALFDGDTAEDLQRVAETLVQVGLAGQGARTFATLSGG